uniref:methyl-accepting chemotaxis protein n=1 Tax=Eubacterium cellulosolvens TaxID=29322 RepID=UPI000482AB64|nr:methyl-accepting chemotaxis protein [[Eubacterium] cellulosolvens]
MKAKRVKKLREPSLSKRLAAIVAAVLLCVFAIMTVSIIIFVGGSMLRSTDKTMYSAAEKAASKMKGMLDVVEDIDKNIQTAVMQMYKEADSDDAGITAAWKVDGAVKGQPKATAGTFISRVTGEKMSGSRFAVETAVVNTLYHAVATYDYIASAGLLMEPDAFSKDIEQYAPFVSKANIKNGVLENLAYDAYKNAEYYAPVKASMQEGSSNAFESDGEKLVAINYPIVVDGSFKGTAVVCIKTSSFNVMLEKYPPFNNMIYNILNGNDTIVYSANADMIGREYSEIVGEEAYKKHTAGVQTGERFTYSSISEKHGKVIRYFAPVQIGNDTWWTQCALSQTDYYESNVQMVIFIIVFMVIALVVLSVVVIMLLTKSLAPLHRIGNAAHKVAEGDFDVDVTYNGKDEIGVLADSIHMFIERLRKIIEDLSENLTQLADGNFNTDSESHKELYVGAYAPLKEAVNSISTELSATMREIKSSANQVSGEAEQVASGSQALAQGSTEQASSVEELSQTMVDISKKVLGTTDLTKEAADISQGSNEAVRTSNDKMQEMSDSMTEITEKANEISKIIKTIDDIAFQTNILALNASIEAARAGAAGKGFAVVADEVGNLAKKSQEAARDTAQLIEDTINAVHKGAGITDETATALDKVSDSFNRIDELVGKISEASEQQSVGIQQVTEGIDQISSVVQTNSATAEESAAASQELSSQAERLHELVSKFQLRE